MEHRPCWAFTSSTVTLSLQLVCPAPISVVVIVMALTFAFVIMFSWKRFKRLRPVRAVLLFLLTAYGFLGGLLSC